MQKQLGELISRERQQIQQRWLQQLKRDIPPAGPLDAVLLKDGMPDYLDALARMLMSADSSEGRRFSRDAWVKVAREHGITRVRIGFDVGQLVYEFAVLRRVIHEVAREQGVSMDGSHETLIEAIEEAVSTAVRAYMDARDYEARRTQAETIGFLTHELRDPLAAAIIAATQLRRRAEGEKQVKMLDALDRSHARLTQLIDSVLLTEKLEVDVQRNPRRIALGELLGELVEAAQIAARKKGLDFTARYDPALELEVDPLLTRSAVQNLLDNATKYTDEGGVSFEVEDNPDGVVMHVRDTCVGISAEELKTLFEPFKRGATGRSNPSGTGLGLAIARRAVRAQNGDLSAESPGHSGCHFWISLPKKAQRPG